MADKAYITPTVFKWARESARMSIEDAARKVHVSNGKLLEWEEGISQPTIRQAETLAKAYRRPFALLFLPEIPRDFQPLQDFRRKTAKPLGTGSVFIIREIQQKQRWLSDLYQENEEEALSFIGKFSAKSDPQVVARDILNIINLNPKSYATNNPIKEWIKNIESAGIFVSRTSFIHSRLTLDSEELQGFAIADKYAPFIFLNSDDWNAPQLFTLVHELAHIWIGESGVSNEISPEISNNNVRHPIERFCNKVAANALMPSEVMTSLNSSVFKSSDEVFRHAKNLGVSAFAFLVRALNLELVSLNIYTRLKRDADDAFEAFLQKEAERESLQKNKSKQGGPNYYTLLVNKNSRQFTKVVIDAFRGGYVEPTVASGLLNTHITKIPRLEAVLHNIRKQA
jgi:Zn-dependent peptidase ImmA (M78 family)/DNA-binding XRE family transcriptional regulator